MVKWGDWGCWPNPYSYHICVIYIKGVWQPLYAVDVHMDVSPPSYGRSCRPSLWNFATNLGKSQLICDGEMRWLRLLTQPIFISHLCYIYIYIKCLTTFMGPRGASLSLTCEQTPRGALFRWDSAWGGNWFCTYSYVISTHLRKSSRSKRRPRYGST